MAPSLQEAFQSLSPHHQVLSPVQKMVEISQQEIFVMSTGTVKSLVKTRRIVHHSVKIMLILLHRRVILHLCPKAPHGRTLCQ
ncbi:hypothetical protein HOLleu_44278 [Holothuria leucospilota]|uniref:Uncharacterized protein n=1 Tax=Holothuria leucospilota TaxID=206669 RepID=A0A9Q0YB16_HOLLE|nr:hypothetical protein HOLleu_44278 [Holothuria leucospilota]